MAGLSDISIFCAMNWTVSEGHKTSHGCAVSYSWDILYCTVLEHLDNLYLVLSKYPRHISFIKRNLVSKLPSSGQMSIVSFHHIFMSTTEVATVVAKCCEVETVDHGSGPGACAFAGKD